MKKDQDFGFYGKGLDGYVHYRQGMEEAKRSEGAPRRPSIASMPVITDEESLAQRHKEFMKHALLALKVSAAVAMLSLGVCCYTDNALCYGLYMVSGLAVLLSAIGAIVGWHRMSPAGKAAMSRKRYRSCKRLVIGAAAVGAVSQFLYIAVDEYDHAMLHYLGFCGRAFGFAVCAAAVMALLCLRRYRKMENR